MLNHLQAASRLLARASLALFTAVVLLLIQSAFWSGRVSAWMQIVILATSLVAYFRPQYGLLALAVLAPFGRIGSGTLDSQMRGAEALVLAFLAGVLVRGWTLRGFRSFPSSRLETAALVFGLVVAASCLEQIWFLQIQRDFPWTFAGELLTYASRNYLTSLRGFGMIFRAMLLLEGLALLCLTVRYARAQAAYGERVVVAIAAGSVAVVLFTFAYILDQFRESPLTVSFLEYFTLERWAVHISDVNAAGSFFAMAMFIAFGLALRNRRYSRLWWAGGLLLAGALLMTFSRTALVAVALVTAFALAAATLGRAIGVARTIAATGVVLTALMVGAWNVLPHEYFGAGAVTAVTVRRLFLEVTGRMLMAYPLFGVGIGQYALWSHHFAAPEMFEYYRSENAHNNFAQIAGELGIVGLTAFLLVLVLALRSALRTEKPPRATMPVLLGLAAFVLSWLGGHPLLVPEVAFPFWITLGVMAAFVPGRAASRAAIGAVVVATVVLAVSVPFRVHAKAEGIDFTRVSYGLSNGRLASWRARFFVPAERTRVELPVRARAASEDRPIVMDVFVDDAMIETVTLTDRAWQTAGIDLPADRARRFHQIDLRIREAESDDTPADTRRDAVEIGNWEIITKPNG
jgi:O-antigen ligase